MRKLIVTADDYGMHASVDSAIEECLQAGALRATCLLANMSGQTSGAKLRARFPRASIGVHWNLTQGHPTSSHVSGLVAPDGRFSTLRELRWCWLTGGVSPAEIRTELRAQYERFCDMAGRPDFWNTHENFHVWPGLFDLVVRLGMELGIRAMRCHRRVTVPGWGSPTTHNLRRPLHWLKGQVIAGWSRRAEAGGTVMPDGLLDAPGFGPGNAEIERVVAAKCWRDDARIVEVAVHPATEVNLALFGRLTESRVREYDVYRDPELKGRLQERGIELANFEALHNGR